MSPAIFSTTAAWTKATQPYAASPPGPTIRRLRRKLRRVRLNTAQSYSDLHERARIYSALAARETKGSEHKLVLLRLTEEADVRLERAEASLQSFGQRTVSLRIPASGACAAGFCCVGGLAGLSHCSIA